MDALPQLTPAQQALADDRARCTIAAAAAEARANPDGFVSLRDVRAVAKRRDTPLPSYEAERDAFRRAEAGRWKAGTLIAVWQSLVSATDEAARFHGEPVDLDAVSRLSMAWCLAGRPTDHPVAALARMALDISTDDVHNEQVRPTYRQLLDGWRTLL